MRRDHKAHARTHSYEAGDLVKVSTRILLLCVSPAQTAKLLPLWLGLFKVNMLAVEHTVLNCLLHIVSNTLYSSLQRLVLGWFLTCIVGTELLCRSISFRL
jgi:hypothetical protein